MIATLPIVWKDMNQSISSAKNVLLCVLHAVTLKCQFSILLLVNKKNETSYYLYISNSQKVAEGDEGGWEEIIVLIWQNFDCSMDENNKWKKI